MEVKPLENQVSKIFLCILCFYIIKYSFFYSHNNHIVAKFITPIYNFFLSIGAILCILFSKTAITSLMLLKLALQDSISPTSSSVAVVFFPVVVVISISLLNSLLFTVLFNLSSSLLLNSQLLFLFILLYLLPFSLLLQQLLLITSSLLFISFCLLFIISLLTGAL